MWLINPHTQGRAKQSPVAGSSLAARCVSFYQTVCLSVCLSGPWERAHPRRAARGSHGRHAVPRAAHLRQSSWVGCHRQGSRISWAWCIAQAEPSALLPPFENPYGKFAFVLSCKFVARRLQQPGTVQRFVRRKTVVTHEAAT